MAGDKDGACSEGWEGSRDASRAGGAGSLIVRHANDEIRTMREGIQVVAASVEQRNGSHRQGEPVRGMGGCVCVCIDRILASPARD